MSSKFAEPHILKIWDDLPNPKSLSLLHIGEVLDYSYQLLEHPFFFEGSDSEDLFIEIMKDNPEEYELFNRVVIERIIYETKYYGSLKFDFGVLTVSSQGIEKVIQRIKDFIFLVDKIANTSAKELDSFEVGLHFLRLEESGAMTAAVKYLLNTCQHLILNLRRDILRIELIEQQGEAEKSVFLQRKKADLFQLKHSTDKIIYKGLMDWITIELSFLETIRSGTTEGAELIPIIEKFLAQQEARTTADVLLQHLIHSEVDQFNEKLSDIVMQVFSFHDISRNEPEKVFHSFLLGVFQSLAGLYRVSSNREGGKGRFDIMLIPDHPLNDGVILEVKRLTDKKPKTIESSLNEAIKQIRERDYCQELKNSGTKHYIGIAVAFYGKELYTKWYREDVKRI